MRLQPIIYALCVLSAGIYADELEERKAQLERQIQENRAKTTKAK